MPNMWWFQRFPADDDQSRQRGRAAHPSAARWLGENHPSQPLWAHNLRLDDDDWRAIDALLSSQSETATGSPSDEQLGSLVASLDMLRTFAENEVTAVDPIMNYLLDVWAIAREIGPQVARPSEALLSALVGRDLVTAIEIIEVCDQTWAAQDVR